MYKNIYRFLTFIEGGLRPVTAAPRFGSWHFCVLIDDWLVYWLIDRSIEWPDSLIEQLIDCSIARWIGLRVLGICAACFFSLLSSKSNCSLDVKVHKLRFRFSLWITCFYFPVVGVLFGLSGFSHSFLVYVIRKA